MKNRISNYRWCLLFLALLLVSNPSVYGDDLEVVTEKYPFKVVTELNDPVVNNQGAPKRKTDPVFIGEAGQRQSGPEMSFTIRNTSDRTIRIDAIRVHHRNNFEIQDSFSATMAKDEERQFKVVLVSQRPGTYSGRVTFRSSHPDLTKFTFYVTAGRQPFLPPRRPVAPFPRIAVFEGDQQLVNNNSELDFGAVIKGATAPTKTLTIQNSGTADLLLNSLVLPNGFELTAGQDLPPRLAPGATHVITIMLKTQTVGPFAGHLVIGTNDPQENPFQIHLMGEVIAAPAPRIRVELVQNPANQVIQNNQEEPVLFGLVNQGEPSIELRFLVTNAGTADLDVDFSAEGLANNADIILPAGFELTQALQTTLAPGASGTFKIALSTEVAGTFSGVASFVNSDPDRNPFRFPISGQVNTVVIPAPRIKVSWMNGAVLTEIANGSVAPIDFGTVEVGAASPVIDFVVENTGDADLNVTSMNAPQGFQVVGDQSFVLAPAGTQNFTVELLSHQAGEFSGKVSIANNDSDDNPFEFAVSGSVTGPSVCPGGDQNLAGSDRAIGYAFSFNPVNFETGVIEEPTKVCLTNIGIYHPETGALVGDNLDTGLNAYVLNGKYMQAAASSIGNSIPRSSSPNNVFKFPIQGGDGVSEAEGILWASEVNMYYHINEYRTKVLSPELIMGLKLPAEIENNLLHRQYRQGGYSSGPQAVAKVPTVRPRETDADAFFAGIIDPFGNNLFIGARTRRFFGEGLDVISHALDPSFTVGEYAGLLPFMLTQTDEPFPPDVACTIDWQTSIAGCLNDGYNAWAGYRYTGETEVYKTYSYFTRLWNEATCGTLFTPPCDRGRDIDNVMMFDPASTNGDQIFPFFNSRPSGIEQENAPIGSDRTGLFFAALFYDISLEVGLGDDKADQLWLKTFSLISSMDDLSMSQFGNLIIEAARALWPQGGVSVYEELLVRALASRGVLTGGATSIYQLLPERIGTPSTMNLYNANARFGSLHPDRQSAMPPGTYNYGGRRIFIDQYTDLDDDFQYMSLHLGKESKYGPCDKLLLSDGTFEVDTSVPTSEFGEYKGDGTYLVQLTDRNLGNRAVFVPGQQVRYVQHRNRCENEQQAAHFLDVNPFGFYVHRRIKNGFSFSVSRVSETEDDIEYELTIVDPSLSMTGPRTGPAEYTWTISDANQNAVQSVGQSLVVTLPRNEPILIAITRVRGSYEDVISMWERSNDLDRNSGKAFVADCVTKAACGN